MDSLRYPDGKGATSDPDHRPDLTTSQVILLYAYRWQHEGPYRRADGGRGAIGHRTGQHLPSHGEAEPSKVLEDQHPLAVDVA